MRSEERHFASVHRLPADADAPRAARTAAADLLGQLGAGDERAEDLALVVSELVSNAVVHGPSGDLKVELKATPSTIRIEVSDGGVEPFEWPADDMQGHWGLGLVGIFSERVGVIRRPWTVVWCELDLAARAGR